jgi:hypothetical protein
MKAATGRRCFGAVCVKDFGSDAGGKSTPIRHWEADMSKLATAAGVAPLAGAVGAEVAQTNPARIILLRHGEKKNGRELCGVGKLRAQALAAQYLGKGAPGNDVIFGNGGKPDAFFAVTAHTQETALPSAHTWGKPLTIFSVPPEDPNEETDLDTQTQKAAAALASADYAGKIVVVVWEHKHIANENLTETFWMLLKLGGIPNANVPKTWAGTNYDYFWIIDYKSAQPTFTAVPQAYASAAYAQVPNNPWGEDVDQTKFPEFYQDCKQ